MLRGKKIFRKGENGGNLMQVYLIKTGQLEGRTIKTQERGSSAISINSNSSSKFLQN